VCVFVERKTNTHKKRSRSAKSLSMSQKDTRRKRVLTYGIFLWVAYFDPEYVI